MGGAKFYPNNKYEVISETVSFLDCEIIPEKKKNTISTYCDSRVGGGPELPYPILFVHGLVGDSDTWGPFAQWLSPALGDPVLLGYCLNNDSYFSNSNVRGNPRKSV